jgi:hypothetical protein
MYPSRLKPLEHTMPHLPSLNQSSHQVQTVEQPQLLSPKEPPRIDTSIPENAVRVNFVPPSSAPSPAIQSQYRGRQWAVQISTPNYFTTFFEILCDKVEICRDILRRNFAHYKKRDLDIAKTFGYGMGNDGNSCYIIAVLQALRFTELRSKLTPSNSTQKGTQDDLYAIFDTVEGKNGKLKETASCQVIKAFKRKMIEMGFRAENISSQEDPAELVQFLLDQIGAPLFGLKTQVHHGLDLKVPSFDKGIESQNHLPLSIAHAANGTELKDLAIANLVEEEVEARNVQIKHLMPRQVQAYLKKLKEFTPCGPIETLQSVYLLANKLPWLLPILIKRYSFDAVTGVTSKQSTAILPSETVFFPLVEDPSKKAKYILDSIVVHSGRSVRSGHCYTYVPKIINGESVWIEFNDENVYLHKDVKTVKKDPWQTPYEDACENGYVYFYKFDSIV